MDRAILGEAENPEEYDLLSSQVTKKALNIKLGSKLRSSCLHRKNFTHSAIFLIWARALAVIFLKIIPHYFQEVFVYMPPVGPILLGRCFCFLL